jgi:Ca2+:H+ antiporter
MSDGDRTPTGGRSSAQPETSRQGSSHGTTSPSTATPAATPADVLRKRLQAAAPPTSYGKLPPPEMCAA